jgi:hypothetical protein
MEIDMKSIIGASAMLLLAGLGSAPLAAAQTVNTVPSQPVISRATAQPYAVPQNWQQAKLPSGQTFDPPARSIGMGSDFSPYPPGYGLYKGGNG